MNIKALMIDFGDTLAYVDEPECMRYARELWETLQKQGYGNSFEHFEESWAKTLRQSSKGQAKSFNDLWRLLFTELKTREDALLMKELNAIRRTYSNNLFKLYEAVPQTLSRLKKRYKLVLVSNCSYGLSHTIKHLGLNKYFSNIILSYQVGARKPDRLIYTRALEAGKLKADECMFIADEISDLEGARELGMKTLLVRQGKSTLNEAKDTDFKPNLECDRISELPPLLKNYHQQ